MTRAVAAVMRWARSALGLGKFTIYVQSENVASVAVAERAGFQEQGESVDFPDGKQRLVYRRAAPAEERHD